MKVVNFIPTLLLLPLVLFTSSSMDDKPETIRVEETLDIESKSIEDVVIVEPTPTDILVNALIYVESKGNDSAIGDTHLGSHYAVGALQIRPIMVKEVNRILKLKGETHRFKLKDRFSREKSIQMFVIWKEFHHKDSDFEAIARSWNGGPKGPKNPRTYSYWKKVEKQLTGL